MKIRYGFVSNSSSSSFVVHKNKITPEQIWAIKNHGTVAKWMEDAINLHTCDESDNVNFYCMDVWDLTETDDKITGYTYMDNFDIGWFLMSIGVDKDAMEIDKDD